MDQLFRLFSPTSRGHAIEFFCERAKSVMTSADTPLMLLKLGLFENELRPLMRIQGTHRITIDLVDRGLVRT